MKKHINPSYESLLRDLNLDDVYIKQAFEFYHQRYLNSEAHQLFVMHSARIPDELRSHDYIGLCDRTLGNQLPKGKTLEGGAIRGHYQHSGLFIASGGELFRGCLVFPHQNNSGQIVSATGYRYGRVRNWQQEVIHWEKQSFDELVTLGLNNAREVAYGKAYH